MQDVDMQVEVPPVEFCFSRSSLDAVVKIVFIEDSGYGGGGGTYLILSQADVSTE